MNYHSHILFYFLEEEGRVVVFNDVTVKCFCIFSFCRPGNNINNVFGHDQTTLVETFETNAYRQKEGIFMLSCGFSSMKILQC